MIREKLSAMISASTAERVKLIDALQQEVWSNDRDSNDPEMAILLDLAYDLGYYEPNEKLRAEDPSFYGDERLREEVSSALIRLDALESK